MATAVVEPSRTIRELGNASQPRCAPQQTSAGAVMDRRPSYHSDSQCNAQNNTGSHARKLITPMLHAQWEAIARTHRASCDDARPTQTRSTLKYLRGHLWHCASS